MSPADAAAWLSIAIRAITIAQKMGEFADRDPTEQEIALLEAEKNAADAAWQQALEKLRGA